MRRTRGFTLLEVLIALAVLAVAAAAVLRQTSYSTTQQQRLAEKTVALWLAENEMTTLRSLPDWPDLGRSSDTVERDGREWLLRREVISTDDPDLRRIEVTVSRPGSEDSSVLTLTTFRGRH